MRRLLALFMLAMCSLAEASPKTPAPKPAPALELSREIVRQLESGIPFELEVRANLSTLTTCTITYDLWTRSYSVKPARGPKAVAPDAKSAALACLDADQLVRARGARLTVREAPPRRALTPQRTTNQYVWCGGVTL